MSLHVADREIEWYVPIVAAITIGYLVFVIDVTSPYEAGGLLAFQRSDLSGLLLDLVLFVPPFAIGTLQHSRDLRTLGKWLVVSVLSPRFVWLAVLSRGYYLLYLDGPSRSEIGGPLFPFSHGDGMLRWGSHSTSPVSSSARPEAHSTAASPTDSVRPPNVIQPLDRRRVHDPDDGTLTSDAERVLEGPVLDVVDAFTLRSRVQRLGE